jgi:high-affinity nickel-transport protein
MSELGVTLLLLASTLFLGLQHGIDWDHIAAISDITGTAEEPRRGFLLGTIYALGHATVVTALGALAIMLGIALPSWVDGMMEPLVGATLVFLGLWIIYSLIRSGGNFQLRSRWMLLFDGLRALWAWVLGRLRGTPQPFRVRRRSTYGVRTSFGIGMIHGIGAETASQAFLFLSIAGVGGRLVGSLMLAAFVMGLVISNTGIVVASLFGFRAARENRRVYMAFGGGVALFSLGLGAFFLAGQGTLLPPIITTP